MTRVVAVVMIAAYMVVASLPVLAPYLGMREQHINGSLPPAKRPPLTFARVTDESFQHDFTRWFENARGLLGHAVYADNGVLYRRFGETRVGSRVRLGRDPRNLFIDEDIDYLNRLEHGIPTAATLDGLADSIARTQRLLQARGQALVPVIIPAKTSVYRDDVAPRWRRGFGARTPSDIHIYERLVAQLDARGVTYVDMRAELSSGRHRREDVWGLQARHWSLYGACLALRQIAHRHGELLGRPPLPYTCALERQPVKGDHDDFDLWRLLNLWKVRRTTVQVPVAAHDEAVTVAPVPALFVGTSFNWALIRDAASSKLLAPIHMHYYDSQVIAWPENTSVKTAAGEPAWRAVMADKELIVLDLMEAALYSGHVYAENFLLHAEALAREPAR